MIQATVRRGHGRDDEWVFSGYLFTDWCCGSTGPANSARGRYPPRTRTSFGASASATATVAMRSWPSGWSTGPTGPLRSPTTARRRSTTRGTASPERRLVREGPGLGAGVSIRQKNAYLIFAFEDGSARRIEELRHRLLHPVEVTSDRPPRVESARASGEPGTSRRGR